MSGESVFPYAGVATRHLEALGYPPPRLAGTCMGVMLMAKIDLEIELRLLYNPSPREVVTVDVPA